ncbi:hypothetical protein IFM89_011541 [Coptis chinensis]|uniref:Disease resistance N-terminal domain-containing protein n=1 Tax=Coptis chinensis TaxID=261450 RepID=A0A835IWE0_9MAGN|nr:hypothetical protein IFM89_011541 [Coptis chinensis]
MNGKEYLKLSLVIEEEAKLLLGVDEHVLSLQNELDEWIKYFLKDAEKKRNIVPMVDVWVRQVRNLAYDAEDVIDAFIIQVEEHRRKNICFGAFGSGSKLKTHHEIGKNIEQIYKRSKEILDNRKKYGDNQSSYNLDILQDSDQGSQNLASRPRRSTTIEEPIIVKKIYNRDDIVNNFCIRAWIFVSQEYSVTDL